MTSPDDEKDATCQEQQADVRQFEIAAYSHGLCKGRHLAIQGRRTHASALC